jgi:propanediol dehydratase small subunit
MECIEAIREYRDNKDKYLPLIDHEKSTFKAEFITAIVPDIS